MTRGSPDKNSPEAMSIALKHRTVDFKDAELKCCVCQEATYGAKSTSATCDRCRRRFHVTCGFVGLVGEDEYAFCNRCIDRSAKEDVLGIGT